MSRVLPNAMVAQAFRKLGIRNEFLEADLPPMVDLGLQKLYGYQHNDGGWGWWYDDATDLNQTAYVLFGLAMTEQAGFDVDDAVVERGTDALRGLLVKADPRAQAYGAYVLAMAGQPVSITLTLTDALGLDLFSQAALAIALDATGEVTTTAALLDNLREASIQDATSVHWSDEGDDAVYSRKVMGSTVRTTAMVADALARLDPESPLLPGAIRWLMGRRQGQGWGDTQKTSFAILALSDYLLASRELGAATSFQVYVNDTLWQEGVLSQAQAPPTLILTYTLSAGEAITASESITTSEAITQGAVVTAGQAITSGEVITTAEGITVSASITTGASITASQALTASQAVTASQGITASRIVTAAAVPSAVQLQPGDNVVRIVLGAPGEEPRGRLYYAVTLAAQRAPRGGGIPALQSHARSIGVEREYRLVGSKESAASFRRGDLVEVRLTLDVPEEAWYVVVDDPLPAGFEALNERLGTTSHAGAAYEEADYHWQDYGYNRKDVRDERVSFFISQLAPGRQTYTYLMRATTDGSFTALPTQVYPMYEPEVWSRSESSSLQIEPH
jgi:uncharacterized protein YfaS (alpha-2-macroglobulin family)